MRHYFSGLLVVLLFTWTIVTYFVLEGLYRKVYIQLTVVTKLEIIEDEIRKLKRNQNINRHLHKTIEVRLTNNERIIKNEKRKSQFEILNNPVQSMEKDGYNFIGPYNDSVIAVLVLACNRETVFRCLDGLLKFRPSPEQFPVIVSQDCKHNLTSNTIRVYDDHVIYIQQPDQSEFLLPSKEKENLEGYFKIARHYGWALNYTFMEFGFNNVIIIEDDLDISPDIFEYFLGTLPILKADPTLWCVSAWNDNGKLNLIQKDAPDMLYRTDFFPGLGWMLRKSTWIELAPKWPKCYWDDWIRQPDQRKERACIRPEISRTRTFGKYGVSKGLFYETYLKYIHLNYKFVKFTQLNLSYLLKDNYDLAFSSSVYSSPVVSYKELNKNSVANSDPVRISYYTKNEYETATRTFGLMSDLRSGIPRTAYRGVVSFFYNNRRVYLTPNPNWKNYNTTWS